MYRTAFLRRHDLFFSPKLHASEDLVFAFRAAHCANAIAIVDDAHIIINTRPGSASFAAPDHKTIISHYRALAAILQTAVSAGTGRSSFNHVLASLFALFIRIAAKNRQAKMRRFIIAKNMQLFWVARACPQWDAALFTAALQGDDALLYTCLEENNLQRFFASIDATRAQQCRMLRNRAHGS